MNFTLSLLAEGQQVAAGGMNNPFFLTVLMVGFIAFFYFAVVMPQNKKKKEMSQMLGALKKGDKIVSIGGIHGKVSSVKDNEIVVKVDANSELSFEKSAISRVVTGNSPVVKKKNVKEDKKDDTDSKKQVKNNTI